MSRTLIFKNIFISFRDLCTICFDRIQHPHLLPDPFPLPSSLNVVSKKKKIEPTCAAQIVLGVWPCTGVWLTQQQLYSWRNLTPPLPAANNCQQLLFWGWDLGPASPSMLSSGLPWACTGLVPAVPTVVSSLCNALLCPGDNAPF